MDTSNQKQKLAEAPAPDQPYEWSYIRVAEATVINVISAVIIGTWAIILGLIYAGWTLLLKGLHTPAGLVGILAFILLGAVLMLIILVVVIIAWFRRVSSATLVGMLIGAMVGAAIGAAIDSGKWKTDWAKAAAMTQEQQKQKESNP